MRRNKTGRRLRLIPLILGGYGIFLGLGLAAVGLSEITKGIGLIRALFGLGMVCFGLYGIWDGVCDLVRPKRKTEKAPVSQFILTDTSGYKSSNVTMERLREQLSRLAESGEHKVFDLQILPPLPAGEHGMLRQISCVYYDNVILVAFFEMPKDGYRIYQKSAEPDMAEEWLKQLLSGSPDFSEWKNIEIDTRQERVTSFQHQLLVIFGESWHNEHKFFSLKDLELAIEGVHSGKYQKAVLEWNYEAFNIFPDRQSDLMVVWCKNDGAGQENLRFLARKGTVTQVKFWLVNYLEHGFFEEMSGWSDITVQIEKETRRG